MTAPQPPAADADFTELVDADFPRVDLVGKAANGTSFLIAKAAADGHLTQPLVAPDMVRELIAKADAQEGTVTDPAPTDDVTKAAPPVETGDLVEDAPGGSTADSLPGSPDWEQLDGDTAMNAVATLGRVRACLSWLSGREAQEAVTGGDADGAGLSADQNSWDLDDMACQLNWIINELAGFAVGEHMSAEMADELEQVGKAAAALSGPLGVVERFGPVVKAGRMLSGANESTLTGAVEKIDEASQSIRSILAALPQAPAADDAAVAKSDTDTEETGVANVAKTITVDIKPRLVAADGEPIEKAADLAAELLKGAKKISHFETLRALLNGGQTIQVAKAKGDPQMAVFSADGKLVGVIDPADLNPIAATEAPSEGDTEGAGGDASAGDDAAPADDSAAAAAPAAAPAAADDSRVVPGTDTVQAPPQAPEDDQTPAAAKAAAVEALKEALAPFAEQLGQVAGLAKAYSDLEERVTKMGAQPDDRRSPVLNGARGVPGAVTRDGSGDNALADVKKAIDAEPDPAKRMAMSKDAFLKIASRFQG